MTDTYGPAIAILGLIYLIGFYIAAMLELERWKIVLWPVALWFGAVNFIAGMFWTERR